MKSSISCRTIIPWNKVSKLSKTRKGEMNQVRLKQAFAYKKKLSTTSCNVCVCNAPPQRVTPPQYTFSPMCTNCYNNLHLPLPPFYSPFLSWYRQRSSPQPGHLAKRDDSNQVICIIIKCTLCNSIKWRETRRFILIKCLNQKCFAYKTCSIQVQNTMVFGKANDKGF